MTKPTKQARKVALINVHEHKREHYSAYWNIGVLGDDAEGYRWEAKLLAYEPVGWKWKGKITEARPEAPWPMYPGDVPVRQAQYLKMTPEEQAQVRAQQEARRAECTRIFEAHPKPVYLIDEAVGAAVGSDVAKKVRDEIATSSATDEDKAAALGRAMRDIADTAAQKWVAARIGKFKRKANPQSGYALAFGPFGLTLWTFEQMLRDLARLLLAPILMALGYSTTARNNQLSALRDLIDGGAGAGLLRIYDGSRPATCGTATTLGAELTLSDPCAGAPSAGVLTLSAITADASANASITATWHRFVDSTGTCVVDGNCGTSGSDLNLNTTTIAAGVQVSVTSYTITGGNA